MNDINLYKKDSLKLDSIAPVPLFDWLQIKKNGHVDSIWKLILKLLDKL